MSAGRGSAERMCVLTGMALASVGCNADKLPSAGDAYDMPERSEVPGAGMASAPAPLPATCLLAGMDDVEREASFDYVALGFLIETDGCRARRLTSGMTSNQTNDWANYLLNYSFALFGCPLLFSPLPGGIDAFGLSNTDAVGVPSPMLGPDDVAFLIDTYLTSASNELPIPATDLAALRAHLERAAVPRTDPSLSGRLSDCP